MHTWYIVRAHIDNDGARLQPLALDEVRLADRGDHDVRVLHLSPIRRRVRNWRQCLQSTSTYDGGQVTRATVALSDRGIALAKHSCHGAPDDVAAAQHNGMATCDSHAH